MSHEHYFIDVSHIDRLDVYRLLDLFKVTCPVAQHVVKKALAAGQRGHKDTRRDWQDIADSAARRLQMISEDEATFGQQNTIDCRTDEQKGFNDPRTVAGVDVSFPTERHLSFAPTESAYESGICKGCGVSVLFPHKEGCDFRYDAQEANHA
jgi:hypothetical protein